MMNPTFHSALLLTAAAGSGIAGGVFFAFSTFIMRALDRLPAANAVPAMQSINITVINPLFFAAFFGTALVALILLAQLFFRPIDAAGVSVIAATGIYMLGSVLVTIVFNVPLNDRLAAVPVSGADLADAWQHYSGPWTLWNHVRTVASIAASALFVIGLRLLP